MKQNQISLVVLAAGMGSRFGGLKQIAPIGKNGEILADYSVYDAMRAGFGRVVFIIKEEMEQLFIERVASKIHGIEVELCFQNMHDLPSGLDSELAANRTKPWGTAHALWTARNIIKEPFMVINADDYYGINIYADFYAHLKDLSPDSASYAMAGYRLADTVSASGSVSRGVCNVENSWLVDMTEITNIEYRSGIYGYDADGEFVILQPDQPVSMNAFAMTPSIFPWIEEGFRQFLQAGANERAEYYLPAIMKSLLSQNLATCKVIPAHDKWYGFTHKEDADMVKDALARMTAEGKYPEALYKS